jgi:hypothetical protein
LQSGQGAGFGLEFAVDAANAAGSWMNRLRFITAAGPLPRHFHEGLGRIHHDPVAH